MKKIIITFSLLLIIACRQQEVKKETVELTEIENDSLEYITVLKDSSKQENAEYLDWDLFKISGELPLVCKQKDLYKLLGQPDSIVNPDLNDVCVSHYEDNFKYAYFGEGNFEIHGDIAAKSTIDFNKIELVYGNRKLILNNSTTIELFEKLFPIATKRKQEVYVRKLGDTKCIKLSTSKRMPLLRQAPNRCAPLGDSFCAIKGIGICSMVIRLSIFLPFLSLATKWNVTFGSTLESQICSERFELTFI